MRVFETKLLCVFLAGVGLASTAAADGLVFAAGGGGGAAYSGVGGAAGNASANGGNGGGAAGGIGGTGGLGGAGGNFGDSDGGGGAGVLTAGTAGANGPSTLPAGGIGGGGASGPAWTGGIGGSTYTGFTIGGFGGGGGGGWQGGGGGGGYSGGGGGSGATDGGGGGGSFVSGLVTAATATSGANGSMFLAASGTPSNGQNGFIDIGSTVFSYTGSVQTFVVSTSGEYSVVVDGAQGGQGASNVGGYGAEVTGDLYLTSGTQLELVVGGGGESGYVAGEWGGGGGGGSFVYEAVSTVPEPTNALLLAIGSLMLLGKARRRPVSRKES